MPVAQQHPYGCGIACVAEAIGTSYKEALLLFGPDAAHKAQTFGFYCHEICQAMRNAGWRSYWVEVQPGGPPWSRPNAIVFIPPGPIYQAGHYLNKEPYIGWNNSWSNFPNSPPVAQVQRYLPYPPTFVIYNTPPRV